MAPAEARDPGARVREGSVGPVDTPASSDRGSVFARCAHLVGRDTWWRWGGLIVLALVVSGFEALGAVAIFALMSMITTPGDSFDVPIVGDLRTALPNVPEDRLVVVAAITIAAFFVIRGAAYVTGTYLQARVVFNAGARLSTRLMRGYLYMPYQFHLQRNSSELIRNSFDSVQLFVREVLTPVTKVVSEATIVLGVVVVLAVTAPVVTAVALVVLGPAVTFLLAVIHPRQKRMGRIVQLMSRQSLQSLAQSLEGIRDIKVLGREDVFKREFAEQRSHHARANYRYHGVREVPRTALETLLILFILGFFAVTELVSGGSQSSFPVLGLFAYASLRLKPSLSRIMSGLNSVKFANTAIDDLYDDLVLVEAGARRRPRDVTPLPYRAAIEIRDVSFTYEASPVPILHEVSTIIPHGSFIGIVGPTGGGKSTLVDIVLGLLEPTKGQVLVDGVDVHEHTAAWQSNLGVVPQTVFLIDATLRQNICFGLADDEVDEERVAQVVRLAQLDEFIATLPEGLDTPVGERGARVSGGQRQRIAIARALYRDPSVLVFDEGTSALDNRTEASLIRELEQLRGDRTILTIAHRLTTVQSCDQILLLEGGRITDRGTYDELVGRSTTFRTMARPT